MLGCHLGYQNKGLDFKTNTQDRELLNYEWDANNTNSIPKWDRNEHQEITGAVTKQFLTFVRYYSRIEF